LDLPEEAVLMVKDIACYPWEQADSMHPHAAVNAFGEPAS
jgi:hypothetical protein